METSSNISFLAKRIVPGYYVENGSKVVPLLELFIDFISLKDQPYYVITNISTARDVDQIADEFLNYLKDEIIVDFPPTLSTDLRKFLKSIIMLYRSKGSEASFQYFFRCLYNSFVKITYPRDRLLKPSDGIYVNDFFIIIEERNLPQYFQYNSCIGMKIEGETSKAFGYIKDSAMVYIPEVGRTFSAFQVNNPSGVFTPGEYIKLFYEFENINVQYDFQIRFVKEGTGVFENNQGCLSDSQIVLQDSYYFQNFSYVLTTNIPFNYYRDIFKKLLHPAGMKVFGEYELYEPGMNIHEYPEMLLLWHKLIVKYFLGEFVLDEYWKWNRLMFGLIDGARSCTILEDVYAIPQNKLHMGDGLVIDYAMQSNKDGLIFFTPEGKYIPYTYIDWHRDRFITKPNYEGTEKNYHTIDIEPRNFVFDGILTESGALAPENPEDYVSEDCWVFDGDTGEKLYDFEIQYDNAMYRWRINPKRYLNHHLYIYAPFSKDHFLRKSVYVKSPFQEELIGNVTKWNFAVFENRLLNTDFTYNPQEGTLNFLNSLHHNLEIYLVITETNVTRVISDGVTFTRDGDRSLHIL